MPIREAVLPKGTLYRIGRPPDPLAWIPWEFATDGRFGGRFDDPEGKYRVLYLAEQRLGSFLECLASFRKNAALLAKLGISDPYGHVPDDWHLKRMIAGLRLNATGPVPDLREIETRQALRIAMLRRWPDSGWTLKTKAT